MAVTALAAPVGRAVVAAAPAILSKVKEYSPAVMAKASQWYSNATNNANANIADAAKNSGTAHHLLEGLVRSGYPVDRLLAEIPVLTNEEAAAYRQKLLGIQADLRARGDTAAGGVSANAREAAIAVRVVRKNVEQAMLALNCHNVQQLRERLDAIRTINEADLEAYEIVSSRKA